MSSNADERLLSVSDLTEHLGIGRTTLYRYLELGLPSIRIGGLRRFRRAEVEQWIREENRKHEVGAAALREC